VPGAGRNLGNALAELNEDLRAANNVLPERLRLLPLHIGGLSAAAAASSYPAPPPSPSRSEAGSEWGGFVAQVLR
jgi:hypothetical protein